MEKKIDFSDKSLTAKITYAAVISILCITAIVVGIVSAASKSKDVPAEDNPPVVDEGKKEETPAPENNAKPEAKLTFVYPTVGAVVKEHSLETPVFSLTLGEWRVHTGIDIACDEGAGVFASEAGVVTGIYSDPMLGYTVEITHSGELKTRYSNLASDVGGLKVGDEVSLGDKIGVVGDSAICELAEEPHLHFEVLLKDVKVNPMDYLPK